MNMRNSDQLNKCAITALKACNLKNIAQFSTWVNVLILNKSSI